MFVQNAFSDLLGKRTLARCSSASFFVLAAAIGCSSEPATSKDVSGSEATGSQLPTVASTGAGTQVSESTNPVSSSSNPANTGSPTAASSAVPSNGTVLPTGTLSEATSGSSQVPGGESSAQGESSLPGGGNSGSDSETSTEVVVPATCPSTYSNPLIWEDLPDLEVIRVDDVFYYTASTFHHSPGAPVLRSYDLVHWEYVGHSAPVLDVGASYDLNGNGNAYVDGIWASTLQYRKSNQTFYWMGCLHNAGGGLVFTAPSPEGPWEKHQGGCYYDMGLLIDDDDTMYVAYGNDTISVAQLSPDGFSQVKSEVVYRTPDDLSGPLEGSRFRKIGEDYYIFVTQYANGEYVLRSTNGPFGPYEMKPFAVRLPFAGAGAGGSPHQGGLIDTPAGDWYYVAFNDSYPAGRLPVMAPVTWSDGWPAVTLVDGKWGASYPFPNLPCGAGRVTATPKRETFDEATLGPEWEWNHNPDNSQWSAGGGLTLNAVTVTNDLYAARNTLTRRIAGPISVGTIELDYSAMRDGDVAGLAVFRDHSATIAIHNSGGSARVVMTNGIKMDTSWTTTSVGSEVASAEVSGGRVWLRAEANVRTDNGGQAQFFYSTDGTEFLPLGDRLTMNKDWQYFLGYRFGIFNYATKSLGGFVKVDAFEVQ